MKRSKSTLARTLIRGQQYSQETLPENVSYVSGGQPKAWKLLSILISFTFSSIAGVSSALLSVFLVLRILNPQLNYEFQRYTLLSTLISITALVILLFAQNIRFSLQRIVVFILVISTFLGFVIDSTKFFEVFVTALFQNVFMLLVFMTILCSFILSNSIIIATISDKSRVKFTLISSIILFLLVLIG